MNFEFDDVPTRSASSMVRKKVLERVGADLIAMLLASAAVALPASAQLYQLSSPVELSVPNPVGTCDDGFRLPGNMSPNDAAEPFVAVNPAHPNNVVAAWIQGPIQNNVVAASFDGGNTWRTVPLPLTSCSGGSFLGAGDPWLSFAPNGDLYCISIAGPSPSTTYSAVCKSTDGGMHWTAPLILDTPDLSPDKVTITADPTDWHFVYAAWSRNHWNNHNAIAFARSTDGGQTWEPTRSNLQTPSGQFAYNSQILVLPDGTLVDMFLIQYQKPNQPPTGQTVELMRSSDKGLTWSAPIIVGAAETILRQDTTGFALTLDPDTSQLVRDTDQPSFAADRSGNLYAVWEDGRFSNFQYNEVAFSMSSDGGFTWSTPIRINQTPLTTAPLNRQAFYPVIAVAPNGTLAVTYYDFRFNTPDPGVPTDYWLVQCHPTSAAPATNPGSWGNELRLTSSSFNLEAMQFAIDGYWPGDYFGLAPVGGGGFISVFTAVDPNSVTAIFSRQVGN